MRNFWHVLCIIYAESIDMRWHYDTSTNYGWHKLCLPKSDHSRSGSISGLLDFGSYPNCDQSHKLDRLCLTLTAQSVIITIQFNESIEMFWFYLPTILLGMLKAYLPRVLFIRWYRPSTDIERAGELTIRRLARLVSYYRRLKDHNDS